MLRIFALKSRLWLCLRRDLGWPFFFWLFNDLQPYHHRPAAKASCRKLKFSLINRRKALSQLAHHYIWIF